MESESSFFSLQLALEPEAAALSCQNEILNIEALQSATTQEDVTHSYLVVDCGGGTIDMAAHKLTKKSNGKIYIDEIHQAHGGPCGGFAVNDEFEKLLKDLFQLSNDQIRELKTNHSQKWIRLLYEDFENSKCCNISDEITIIIPQKIINYVQDKTKKTLKQLVSEYKHHKVKYYKDEDDENEESLVLPLSTLNGLYTPIVCQITDIIGEVLKKPECKAIEQILLVGGFAESDFLFHEIERAFPSLTVKRSSVPSTSILQGAIIYGLHQDMITSRKMCQSIGIETWDNFMPEIHDIDKKEVMDGKELCKNVFTKFVEVNKSIHIENKIEYPFTPASKDQDDCKIEIFASHNSRAFYTDDDSCYKIGMLTVQNLPKFGSDTSRKVLIVFKVSGTEITVSAFCNGKTKELPVNLDFIGN